MGELGVDVNEEQEADELAGEGGGDGNQHLGVAGENIWVLFVFWGLLSRIDPYLR